MSEEHTGEIKEALELLDPSIDEHWTKGGKPSLAFIGEIVGADVTRKQVEAIAPGLVRHPQEPLSQSTEAPARTESSGGDTAKQAPTVADFEARADTVAAEAAELDRKTVEMAKERRRLVRHREEIWAELDRTYPPADEAELKKRTQARQIARSRDEGARKTVEREVSGGSQRSPLDRQLAMANATRKTHPIVGGAA